MQVPDLFLSTMASPFQIYSLNIKSCQFFPTSLFRLKASPLVHSKRLVSSQSVKIRMLECSQLNRTFFLKIFRFRTHYQDSEISLWHTCLGWPTLQPRLPWRTLFPLLPTTLCYSIIPSWQSPLESHVLYKLSNKNTIYIYIF